MPKPLDDVLGQLLSEAKIKPSTAAIRDLIKGVAAAPGSAGAIGGPDDWLQLIGPKIPAKLATALNAELALARALDDGLSTTSEERLAQLRRHLKSHKIDGFIIPLADEHQGEYVPKNAQRLTWLTGFTGSAGLAIVLQKKAAIFVDGRYTLQAQEQVDSHLFALKHSRDEPAENWLAENLKPGATLGFDPWLHTSDGVVRLRKACQEANGKLSALTPNPIDVIWTKQPHPPLTPVSLQNKRFTGRTSADKRQEIGASLKKTGLSACVLTAPDAIAWLANIRGGDVPYTPLPLGFAILSANAKLDIYSDLRKYPSALIKKLEKGIAVHPRSDFLPALKKLGRNKTTVGIDLSTAADIIAQTLKKSGAKLQRLIDPCQLPKARKNAVELNGMRQAHLRDGVALTRFLAWLDENARNPKSRAGLSEIAAADQLEQYRREGDKIQGLSFPTISGSGPNGAIVHYRVTPESNRKLLKNSLYLVDSGAQYLDGTTDVTRTIAIGRPSAEMKDRFTRVLKGHIALARAVFPAGTSGAQLDILARAALWQVGLDYDHGTGHGVGSFLGVHEGPHNISKMPNRIALEPGMVVSNEPGFYKTNEYGIRIENLVAVVPVPPNKESTRPLLCFETLTLAPIDLSVVKKDLLNQAELDWINSYHRKVKSSLLPFLDKKTGQWLKQVTGKLA